MEDKTKETNLFDICAMFARGVWKVCTRAVSLLASMLQVTARKWWIVITICILGVLGGLYYSRIGNRMFKVNAIAVVNGPSTTAVKERFEALNMNFPYCKIPVQNHITVLGTEPGEAYVMSHFKTFNVIDCLADNVPDFVDYKGKSSLSDTLNVIMPNLLALQFRVKNVNFVPKAENYLINYLNNNERFQAEFQATLENRMRQHQYDADQIEKLDKLTTDFYESVNNSNQVQGDKWDKTNVMIGKREIQLFTDDVDDYFENKTYRDNQLALTTAPVVLINHFVAEGRAVNGRVKCCVLGLILGWVLGCILGILFEQRKNIWSWLRKEE